MITILQNKRAGLYSALNRIQYCITVQGRKKLYLTDEECPSNKNGNSENPGPTMLHHPQHRTPGPSGVQVGLTRVRVRSNGQVADHVVLQTSNAV